MLAKEVVAAAVPYGDVVFVEASGVARGLRGSCGVSTHYGAHRQYLIWGPCLACHKS